MLPEAAIITLAQRDDVDSISSNRPAVKTTSFLEFVTGASVVHNPGNGSSNGNANGNGTGNGNPTANYDSSGVGIAILDSGIYFKHQAFLASNGRTVRVAKSVDLTLASDSANAGVPQNIMGTDQSVNFYPGSTVQVNREITINTSKLADSDLFGHGTAVASVAAGRATSGAPDSTGVAPGATLYDVKVLGSTGIGNVIAGIDWVLYHSKEYKIRVLNVSLAADSTESFRTDPLCRAARSAVANGITVVVAAGNFGKNANGGLQFGAGSAR